MNIFVALGDYNAVVNYRLIRMMNKILYCGIQRHHVLEISAYKAIIEIEGCEDRKARLFRTVQGPEACALAVRESNQFLECLRPDSLVQCRVVEYLDYREYTLVQRH